MDETQQLDLGFNTTSQQPPTDPARLPKHPISNHNKARYKPFRHDAENVRKSSKRALNPVVQSLLQNKAALRARIAKDREHKGEGRQPGFVPPRNAFAAAPNPAAIGHEETGEDDLFTCGGDGQQASFFDQPVEMSSSSSTHVTSSSPSSDSDCEPPPPNPVYVPCPTSAAPPTTVDEASNRASEATPEEEKPLFKPPGHQDLVDVYDKLCKPPSLDPTNKSSNSLADLMRPPSLVIAEAAGAQAEESDETQGTPQSSASSKHVARPFEDYCRQFREHDEEPLSLTLRVGETALGTQIPDLTPHSTQHQQTAAVVNSSDSGKHSTPNIDSTSSRTAIPSSATPDRQIAAAESSSETQLEAMETNAEPRQVASASEETPEHPLNEKAEGDDGPNADASVSIDEKGSNENEPLWYKGKRNAWHKRVYTPGSLVEVRWAGRWHAAVVVSAEAGGSVYNVRWIKKKQLTQVCEIFRTRLEGKHSNLDSLAEGSSSDKLEQAVEIKELLNFESSTAFDATAVEDDLRVLPAAVPDAVLDGSDLNFDDCQGAAYASNKATTPAFTVSQALLLGISSGSVISQKASPTHLDERGSGSPPKVENNTAEPESEPGAVSQLEIGIDQHPAVPEVEVPLTTPPSEPTTSGSHHFNFSWSLVSSVDVDAIGTQLPHALHVGKMLENVHVLLLGGYGEWRASAQQTTVHVSAMPSPRSIVGSLLRSIFGAAKIHEGVSSLLRSLPSLVEGSSNASNMVLVIGLPDGDMPSGAGADEEVGNSFSSFLDPSNTIQGRLSDPSNISPLRSHSHLGTSGSLSVGVSFSGNLKQRQMRYNMIGLRALGLEPLDGDFLLSDDFLLGLVPSAGQSHPGGTIRSLHGEINIDPFNSAPSELLHGGGVDNFARVLCGDNAEGLPPMDALPLHDRVLSRHVILVPSVEIITRDIQVEEEKRTPISPTHRNKHDRPSAAAPSLLRIVSELNIVVDRLKALLAVAGASVVDTPEEAVIALLRGRSVVQEHGSRMMPEEWALEAQNTETNVDLELLLSTVWIVSPSDLLSCSSMVPHLDPSNTTQTIVEEVGVHARDNLRDLSQSWADVQCEVVSGPPIVHSVMSGASALIQAIRESRGLEVRNKGPAWIPSGFHSSKPAEVAPPPQSSVENEDPSDIERELNMDDEDDTLLETVSAAEPKQTTQNPPQPIIASTIHVVDVPSIHLSAASVVCVGDDYYVNSVTNVEEESEEEEVESELGRVERIEVHQQIVVNESGNPQVISEDVQVTVRLYDFAVSVRRVHPVVQSTSDVGDTTTATSSSLGTKRQRPPRVETSRLRRPRVYLSPFRTKVVALSALDLTTPTYVIEEHLLEHVFVLAPTSLQNADNDATTPPQRLDRSPTQRKSGGQTPLLPPPPLPPPSTPSHRHQAHSNPYITALPSTSPPHHHYPNRFL